MLLIKKWLLRIVGLIVFVVGISWASNNSDLVRLSFLEFETWEWPIAWWVLAAFVVGVFAGILMNTWTNVKLKRDARMARKDAEKGHKELDKVNARAVDATALTGQSVAQVPDQVAAQISTQISTQMKDA